MEKEALQEENITTDASAALSVTVNMKVRYMYSFLFQHLHRSFRGIFGVVLSLAALVMFFLSLGEDADATRLIILLIIGLLFTVVNPVMLWFKAQQQVILSPVFKKPLTYAFSEEGMTVIQEEQSQFLEWNKVVAVRKTGTVLIIYTSRNSGSILAWKELGKSRKDVELMVARGCMQAGVKQIPASMKKLV
jgi:hypothetical protein